MFKESIQFQLKSLRIQLRVHMFKQGDSSSSRQKKGGCFSQQVFLQNLRCFLSSHKKMLPYGGFILKPIERPMFL